MKTIINTLIYCSFFDPEYPIQFFLSPFSIILMCFVAFFDWFDIL